MRTASKSAMAMVSKTASVPAPIGGWNSRDALSAMDPLDAVIMDNWIPKPGAVEIRTGSSKWVTGITGAVETLMQYAAGGVRKLFAAANGSFYDVSASGAVGAAVDTGHSNNRYQYVNFGTAGGSFLVAVNGADSPRKYDGTSWSTNSITGSGLSDANLIHVNVFKQRLFFIEKNTMNFWFLPVATLSGAASKFPLNQWCSFGGELQAMATWTLDGGNGSDDYAVFITTEGEVLIYQGTDPALANSWSLVGVFRIGRPISRRCFLKVGSDLVVITEDGAVPLSRELITGRATPKVAISDKISQAFTNAVTSYRTNFGWQAILYPQANWTLFNIPIQENVTTYQFVRHNITGNWCRFTGLNAFCWEIFNNNLYFGTSGMVAKADTGTADFDTNNIQTDLQPAFSNFGNNAIQKHFRMARPVFNSNGTVSVAMTMNVDFNQAVPTNVVTTSVAIGQPWSALTWPTWVWSSPMRIVKQWQGVDAVGYTGSLRFKMQSSTLDAQLMSIDYLFEGGGVL